MHLRTSTFTGLSLAVLLVAMAGCSSDQQTSTVTGPVGDITAPTVSSTNPANGATGVAVITAAFSEAMTASTITVATFTLTGPSATPVAGSVAYDASTHIARFTPTSVLAVSTTYTATIMVGAKDVAGNAMTINYAWSFKTAASPSTPVKDGSHGPGQG